MEDAPDICGGSMSNSNKIGGFDKYDIESDASALIRAERIKTDKRKGYLAVVKAEVQKQAKAAEEAALVAKTTVKLSQTFGKK